MKILLYTDNHFCQYSSILRKQGAKYSCRLENQIASINWAERLADNEKCDLICTLGDFFDKETICAQEAAALKEIKWSGIFHYMLVGNHEMNRHDLSYNVAELFSLIPQCEVVSTPKTLKLNDFIELCFLPYVLEDDRLPITDYFGKRNLPGAGKRILLSHNDIKGIQMGAFLSKTGFSIEEIEDNFDLMLNGHLHNGEKITSKIINLGNLTGQNFSENAFKYDHCAFILDTDTLRVACYENPYALNFLSLSFDKKQDIDRMTLQKDNLVCSIKCPSELAEEVKEFVNKNANRIIEHRIVLTYDKAAPTIETADISTMHLNHIEEFNLYMKSIYGEDPILLEELQHING